MCDNFLFYSSFHSIFLVVLFLGTFVTFYVGNSKNSRKIDEKVKGKDRHDLEYFLPLTFGFVSSRRFSLFLFPNISSPQFKIPSNFTNFYLSSYATRENDKDENSSFNK